MQTPIIAPITKVISNDERLNPNPTVKGWVRFCTVAFAAGSPVALGILSNIGMVSIPITPIPKMRTIRIATPSALIYVFLPMRIPYKNPAIDM